MLPPCCSPRLGPLVIHAGTEFMRSKGHAPLEEITKTTSSGDLAYHGKNDTYNLRRANQFVWENKGLEKSDGASNNYGNVYAYWRGLIALRNSETGSVLRVGDAQAEDYYKWVLPDNSQQLGYVIAERILVLMNTGEEEATFVLPQLPGGDWLLVANGNEVNHESGVRASYESIGSGQAVSIPARTAPIWIRR